MGALVGAIGFTAFDPAPGSAIGPKFIISLTGGAILVIGAYFWALEGNEGYHIHVDEDGNVTEDHQH
jgi:cytochrome c oxidase subunit 1